MKFALLSALLLAASFAATAADRPSPVTDDTSVCAPLYSLSPSATPEVVVTPCCGSDAALAAPALSVDASNLSDTFDDVGAADERCDVAPDIDEPVQNCEIAYVFVLSEAERARPERYGSTTDYLHSSGGMLHGLRYDLTERATHDRSGTSIGRDLRHGPSFAAS